MPAKTRFAGRHCGVAAMLAPMGRSYGILLRAPMGRSNSAPTDNHTGNVNTHPSGR